MSLQVQPPYNPYAPPAPQRRPESASGFVAIGAPRGTWLTWVYGVVSLAGAVLAFFAVLGGYLGFEHGLLHMAAMAEMVSRVIVVLLGVLWLGLAWAGLPTTLRGSMSPWGAVGRLFIPLYGFYWMFKVQDLLNDAIQTVLAHVGSARRAPKDLGRVAAAVTVANGLAASYLKDFGWLVPIAGHVVWFAYMLRSDAVRRAIAAAPR